MIDPTHITEFDAKKLRLEELLLFWVAVAGKPAKTIAPRIDAVLNQGYQKLGHRGPRCPFKIVRGLGWHRLRSLLRRNGIGCHGDKAKTMLAVAKAGFDLKDVTRDELIQIKGISFKTANCFIMHSRKDAECAAFDTHILKFMRALGYPNVPDSAPQSLKKHELLERHFLDVCHKIGFAPADLDLITWRVYAHHKRHINSFVGSIKSYLKDGKRRRKRGT